MADLSPDSVVVLRRTVLLDGLEGATVHRSIQRADLAARRFDRAFTTVFRNP